ncbi:hypothetical protein D0C16_18960 [Cellvibrio sp. KY-GH-1]|uniref:hypothetical protein n=1 Tax=Cellvibrio sp. KY-GH-1 TaxID=2303332 RepID=UPI0012489891|nr:hypothetical protein [Cellvibrio sp. KY-GH-1]QEY17888.1 hypothetical protein D0C16_18960 [Cellvibrio sp. KY-GH-1]
MKFKFSYMALFMSSLLLQACGGGGLAGDEKDSTDPLIPEPVVDDGSDRPRPSESTPFIKADGWLLKDVAGQSIFLRGANILFGDKPLDRIKNITPVAEIGSNVVRLQVKKTTRKEELEGALVDIVSKNMVALVSLVDDSLTCKDDADELDKVVTDLWLGSWLEVIAQDRFQPHLMINVANQWGPKSVFTENTVGYGDYLEAHKLVIREFRKAGLKVPLVIDAAGCGQDYYSFTAGRARELKAADTQGNLVLSVHGFGETWSSNDKVRTALTSLAKTNMPIVMSGFGGSAVAAQNEVDHLGIMRKGYGDGGLGFAIPWQSAEDKAAYSMTLDEPLFLRGASIRTDVFVPKSYVDNGKLGIVMYLKDANGRYANTGWNQASSMNFDAWNKLNFKLTSVDYLKGIGAYVEDGFDLTAVQKIGFEIVANGKPADVSGNLIFDNLTVFPGIPPVYIANFDTTNEEWETHWGPFTSAAADGKLTILPTGGGDGAVDLQGWKAPSLYSIPLGTELEVVLRVFVPASYANETNAWMKIFGQFGPAWEFWRDVPAQSFAGLTAGAWNTVKFNVDFSDVSPSQAFGIQLGGFSGAKSEPLLVDFVEINDPNKTNTKIVNALQLGSSFNDGSADNYSVYWDKMANMAIVNGVMEITNTNTSGTADVAIGKADIANKSLNFEGPVTVKMKVFVPESFAGTDFYFQTLIQDSDWSPDFTVQWKIDKFTPGDWTEFTYTVDSFPDGFNRKGIMNNFVIMFGGNVNGTIKVDDVEIYGNVEVEDSQPILTVGFESQAEADVFKFDYASGGLSEGVLAGANAKAWVNSTLPFGWIANSWIGDGGYDMSTSESAVTLTPRGEEIANGEFGIKMTSLPASFVKP